MRETFSAWIKAGSARSASVDVAIRIVLERVCCDGEIEVEGDSLKKWDVVCVCSRRSMRYVVRCR